MNRLFVFLLVAALIPLISSGALAGQKKVLIISDIDDTIKVSHILSTAGKISRAADITTPFLGMPQLYQLIINENVQTTKIVYLSNAPETIAGIPALKYSHQTFLSYNHFPYGILDMRESLFEQDHKIKEIRRLLQNEKPDVVIMIGDNGERDTEVYYQATQEFKNKLNAPVMLTFIHQLYSSHIPVYQPNVLAEQGKVLKPGQIGYLTPIEIALSLNQKKLLKDSSVDWLTTYISPRIVDEDTFKWDGLKPIAFPAFTNCSDFKWTYRTQFMTLELEHKIKTVCN